MREKVKAHFYFSMVMSILANGKMENKMDKAFTNFITVMYTKVTLLIIKKLVKEYIFQLACRCSDTGCCGRHSFPTTACITCACMHQSTLPAISFRVWHPPPSHIVWLWGGAGYICGFLYSLVLSLQLRRR